MNRRTTTLAAVLVLVSLPTRPSSAGDVPPPFSGMVGIRACGVSATNPPAVNTANLQKAIDTASASGGAIFVDPTDEPYPLDGGLVLRENVSLIGVQGPTGRGTRHPSKPQPVGSVFRIEDEKNPFISVESATQIRGVQFWYPRQSIRDPQKVIAYPPTIRLAPGRSVQGVTLSSLTFYGEYLAMDFAASRRSACELITIEHCYGYPLGGVFVRIDYCYDVPRVLHCHVNPGVQRRIGGQYSKAVVDSVVARKTFTFVVDHTDNAQLIDLFTFGAYGGAYLGPATYGQLTNFNFDCVTVGIHKLGDNTFSRNWQIAQGAIVANVGATADEIHPIVIEGQGHTSLSNVEAFSGPNGALTALGKSQDFLLVRGDKKLTATLTGCRMRNYESDSPVTRQNPASVIRLIGCFDKEERPVDETLKSE